MPSVPPATTNDQTKHNIANRKHDVTVNNNNNNNINSSNNNNNNNTVKPELPVKSGTKKTVIQVRGFTLKQKISMIDAYNALPNNAG